MERESQTGLDEGLAPLNFGMDTGISPSDEPLFSLIAVAADGTEKKLSQLHQTERKIDDAALPSIGFVFGL